MFLTVKPILTLFYLLSFWHLPAYLFYLSVTRKSWLLPYGCALNWTVFVFPGIARASCTRTGWCVKTQPVRIELGVFPWSKSTRFLSVDCAARGSSIESIAIPTSTISCDTFYTCLTWLGWVLGITKRLISAPKNTKTTLTRNVSV